MTSDDKPEEKSEQTEAAASGMVVVNYKEPISNGNLVKVLNNAFLVAYTTGAFYISALLTERGFAKAYGIPRELVSFSTGTFVDVISLFFAILAIISTFVLSIFISHLLSEEVRGKYGGKVSDVVEKITSLVVGVSPSSKILKKFTSATKRIFLKQIWDTLRLISLIILLIPCGVILFKYSSFMSSNDVEDIFTFEVIVFFLVGFLYALIRYPLFKPLVEAEKSSLQKYIGSIWARHVTFKLNVIRNNPTLLMLLFIASPTMLLALSYPIGLDIARFRADQPWFVTEERPFLVYRAYHGSVVGQYGNRMQFEHSRGFKVNFLENNGVWDSLPVPGTPMKELRGHCLAENTIYNSDLAYICKEEFGENCDEIFINSFTKKLEKDSNFRAAVEKCNGEPIPTTGWKLVNPAVEPEPVTTSAPTEKPKPAKNSAPAVP